MELIVQNVQDSYDRLVGAVASLLEVKEASGGERVERSDKALNSFLECLQLFNASCDRAQEFVESVRQRIGSECLVDEATGKLETGAGAPPPPKTSAAVSPLSAVRLEQLSKAVRWLVIDLQHGNSQSSATAPGGSMVASED